MKLAAFLQLHNELEKGNLRRCLDNCRQWADAIFIYDDCSTDGSQAVYREYTPDANVIYGTTRDFAGEIAHKAELLELTLRVGHPDWIVWLDGDAVLDRELTVDCRQYLYEAEIVGCRSAEAHYVNLWRHPAYFRLDNHFNSLECCCFWRNTGDLRYDDRPGLHRQQYPHGTAPAFPTGCSIIHYGFASQAAIERKYLTYKGHGQRGWELDRLIDERGMVLAKLPRFDYPEGLVPDDWETAAKPEPLSYSDIRTMPIPPEFLP